MMTRKSKQKTHFSQRLSYFDITTVETHEKGYKLTQVWKKKYFPTFFVPILQKDCHHMQSSVISKQIYIIHNCYNFLYPIILFVLTACGNNGFRSFALPHLPLILFSYVVVPIPLKHFLSTLSPARGWPLSIALQWLSHFDLTTTICTFYPSNRGNKKIIPFLIRPFHTLLVWPRSRDVVISSNRPLTFNPSP